MLLRRQARRCAFAALSVGVGVAVLVSLAIVALVAVAAVLAATYAAAQSNGGRRGGGGGAGGGLRLSSRGWLGTFHEGFRTWNEVTWCYWCLGGTNPFFRPMGMMWRPID